MNDVEQDHAQAVEDILATPGRVFVLGGVDSGKTTFTRMLAGRAVAAGIPTAIVDADLGQSTIGPPTTVGMVMVSGPEALEAGAKPEPDALTFVGSDSPRDHFLPLVVGTARLVMRSIEMGARLIVVDTSGLIGGVAGQTLKLAKAELCRPHHVVALEHGSELDPIVGVLERFTAVQIHRLRVDPQIGMRSVDERAEYRQQRLAEHFGDQMHRWRVKPTVFLPSLPPGLDLAKLDGILVGVDNGEGECLGLGILEYHEENLRLLTPVGEGVKSLRLGSLCVQTDGSILGRIDIRTVLGSD